MVSKEDPRTLISAKSLIKPLRYSALADRLLFAGCGATASLVLYIAFYSSLAANLDPITIYSPVSTKAQTAAVADLPFDPPSTTFYDDPSLSYTIDHPITGWDEKRRDWLRHHPSFSSSGGRARVLMVTGSAPAPCHHPVGDHLLLRFFKNKVDYCRIHGVDIFYNTALFHPGMAGAWAKIPLLRAAMVAHPESEWIWWVDSDAAFTDMEFWPPFHGYRTRNLVVPGWPHQVYVDRSWVGLNAGVFLIRNCQWSLDFLEAWARMGPQTPEFEQWGRTIQSELSDKITPESDDQSALVLLLLKEKEKWGDRVYIESAYDLHGYWAAVVGRLANSTEMYRGMERRVARLRRRRAEKVTEGYGETREQHLEWEVEGEEERRRRRLPFVTHFTGCQPCGGGHSPAYSWESCLEGMHRALDVADDQVLRSYGFGRPGGSAAVRPLPFDFPIA